MLQNRFPVDSPSIDQPWRDMICWLTEPSMLLPIVQQQKGRLTADQTISFCYRASILEWLVRLKWDSSFKISLPTRYRNAFKPEGELWFRVLNLVQEVYLLETSGYEHPSVWFLFLLEEGILGGINHNCGKDFDVRQIQKDNRQLSALENPIDRNAYPRTWQLIEKARLKAERLDRFRASAYKPLVDARMRLAQELRSSKRLALFESQGELLQQKGRGRKTRIQGVTVHSLDM